MCVGVKEGGVGGLSPITSEHPGWLLGQEELQFCPTGSKKKAKEKLVGEADPSNGGSFSGP